MVGQSGYGVIIGSTSGGGGGGVTSVTGNIVNNSDPTNPVVTGLIGTSFTSINGQYTYTSADVPALASGNGKTMILGTVDGTVAITANMSWNGTTTLTINNQWITLTGAQKITVIFV